MSSNSVATLNQADHESQTSLSEIENHGLFEAVEQGDQEKVQEALNNGAEINAKWYLYGETALHTAARFSHGSIIDLLLAQGADFNARDSDDWTLLMSACFAEEQQQALPVVKLLLEKSKTLASNTPDLFQSTILSGYSNMHESITSQMSTKPVPYINISSKYGSTALTVACSAPAITCSAPTLASSAATTEIVRFLLDNQADVNAQDREGDTPFILAARYGNVKMVTDVLEFKPDIHKVRTTGRSPLHQAMRREDDNDRELIVDILLKKGLSASLKDDEGTTPLHLASEGGLLTMIQKLLDQPKVDVNSQNYNKATALHRASKYGHLGVVEYLLNCDGIQLNLQNSDGATPLFLAVEKDHSEVVRKLLGHAEIDGNVSGPIGMTPLHVASEEGRFEIVTMLLDWPRIKVNATDLLDRAPLVLAVENYRTLVVQRLLKQPEIDPCITDFRQESPLHKASEAGRLNLVNMIISENKEQINARNDSGLTPLHLACRDGHLDVARQLSQSGAKSRVGRKSTQSAWFFTVQHLFQILEDSPFEAISEPGETSTWDNIPSMPKRADVEFILALADDEDKESATSWADNDDRRAFLADVMGIKVSKLIDYELFRLAKSPDFFTTEEIVRLLEEYTEFEPPPITALQWAAFHGRHDVVWWLLKNSKPSGTTEFEAEEDREVAKAIAKSRRDRLTQQKDNKEGRAEGTREKMKGFKLTVDMLTDPPVVENARSDSYVEYDPAQEEILGAHWATIVDFYQRDGRVELLRRSESVFNVIYAEARPNDEDKGPEGIMNKARTDLKKISSEAAEEKKFEKKDLLMRWIHLPANIMRWMEDLAKRISLDQNTPPENWPSLNDLFQRSWHELPTETAPGRFMKPVCLKEAAKRRLRNNAKEELHTVQRRPDMDRIRRAGAAEEQPHSHQSVESQEKAKDSRGEGYVPHISGGGDTVFGGPDVQKTGEYERVALYMPYISFGLCHRKEQPTADAKASGIPEKDSVSIKKELKALEKYQNLMESYKEQTIHGSRSLDQFFYNSLPDTDMDDRDQNQANMNKNGHPLPSSVQGMARFMVTFCVDFLHSLKWEDFSLSRQPETKHSPEDTVSSMSVQLVYEQRINLAATKEKQLFSNFKNKMKDTEGLFHPNRAHRESGNAGRVEVSTLNYNYEDRDWASISGAAELLDEVKDILDELSILKTLVTRQLDVWQDLVGKDVGSNNARGPAYTLRGVQEMIDMADRLQKSVNDILGLEQNGINIDQAQESARQGTILMAFTIVTVVFTPLSFLTSLFALNVTSFQHSPSGDIEYEPGWLFPILFCCSTAIIGLLMIYAFKGQKAMRNLRKTWKEKISENLKREMDEKWKKIKENRARRTGSSDGSGFRQSLQGSESFV